MQVLGDSKYVTFLCIGSGDDTQFRKMVPKVFKANIKFLGRQNNVESIINICCIGVLTSNPFTHGEGISNAILEFMSLGKPVIATEGGGTKEIILNNETGFIITPQSPLELSSKILELLKNEKLRGIMGINSKKRIESLFNIEKMTEDFIKIYEQ